MESAFKANPLNLLVLSVLACIINVHLRSASLVTTGWKVDRVNCSKMVHKMAKMASAPSACFMHAKSHAAYA